MIRLGCRRSLGVVLRRQVDIIRCSSTSASQSYHPNAPLELDPAFQALLRDVDISLRTKLHEHASGSRGHRELEVFPNDPDAEVDYLTSAELDAQDDMLGQKEGRKSPAAAFGSQRIGAVVLPFELQSTIGKMISGECEPMSLGLGASVMPLTDSDKNTLHHDAQRLFMGEDGTQAEWHASYDARYRSSKEAGRHALRDATAFATVALPAHYSVVYSVLDHVKQRLGPEWEVRRVVDWGAATGSGLWFVYTSSRASVVW